MNTYGVIDIPSKTIIGSYRDNRVKYTAPFGDRVNLLHFLVDADKYVKGYYLDNDNNLQYDFAYEPPAIDPLVYETSITASRQAEGFALYQKIFADISVDGTLSNIDASLTIYPNLQTIRCLLKDGMGETSLRYLIKTIIPLGVFSTEQTDRWKGWIREFCHNYMPAVFAGSTAAYDSFLDNVETAADGAI